MKTSYQLLLPAGIAEYTLQLADIAFDLVQILSKQEFSTVKQTNTVADVFQLPQIVRGDYRGKVAIYNLCSKQAFNSLAN